MTIESDLQALVTQTNALNTTVTNELTDVNADVSAVRTRVTTLETKVNTLESTIPTGGTTPTTPTTPTTNPVTEIVELLPTTNNYEGRTVLKDGILFVWDGQFWVEVKSTFDPTSVPESVIVVANLPSTGTDGDVIFNNADGFLYSRTNGVWTKVVVTVTAANEVANASITVAKFAQGLRPVEIADALPSSGNVVGRLVFLTTDNKLYRYNGTAFINGIATTDLTGTISADQIAANAITTGKIQAGAITASQIASSAINTTQLAAGSITSDKIVANAITGDKIAANSITSDKIVANSITAGKIAVGAITASQIQSSAIDPSKLTGSTSLQNVGSNVSFGLGAPWASGTDVAGGVFRSNSVNFASIAMNAGGGNSSVSATTNTDGTGGAFVGWGGWNGVTSYQSRGILGWGSGWGGFFDKLGGKYALLGGTTYSLQGNGTIGPFTGAHDGLYLKTSPTPEVGDILIDQAIVAKQNVDNAITTVTKSSTPNQKGAIGVLSSVAAPTHIPVSLSRLSDKGFPELDPQYASVMSTHKALAINSLGEGLINVVGEGGNIEIGDLIVTSSVAGKGMKQSDDIVRSITVAKSREAVSFSAGEVKQVACIYLAG